jgi:hypothetical protein
VALVVSLRCECELLRLCADSLLCGVEAESVAVVVPMTDEVPLVVGSKWIHLWVARPQFEL